MYRGMITDETDFDEYKETGTYYINNAISDLPVNYGGLIVFNCAVLIVQICCNLKSNNYYIRNNWNNEIWTNWAKIQTI